MDLDPVTLLDEMKRSGVGPILATTQCRFRKPLTYPDRIRAGATVKNLQQDRFTMLYCIESVAWGAIADDGEGLIVAFDYHEKRKTALPDSRREKKLRQTRRGRKKTKRKDAKAQRHNEAGARARVVAQRSPISPKGYAAQSTARRRRSLCAFATLRLCVEIFGANRFFLRSAVRPAILELEAG